MIDKLTNMDPYLDWAKVYILHRDLLKKEISSLSIVEDTLIIKKLNSSDVCLSINTSDLSLFLSRDFNSYSKVWIICDNSKQRISDIIKNWECLSSNSKFRLICIDLKTERKWLLNPLIHSKIVSFESLAKSLTSIRNNS